MKGRAVPFPSVPARALAEAVGRSEPGLEQMVGESDKAYKLFLQYCIMGPKARAVDVAGACGLSKGFVGNARIRYSWGPRIEEWWRQREKRAMVEGSGKAEVAGEPEREERRESLRQEEWQMHRELMAAGREALERWRGSDKVPTLAELVKVLELASRLGRLATGLPLNYTEVSGSAVSPIRVEIEAALERAYGDVVDTVVVNEEPKRVEGGS